jgi:hypothetical protein
MPQTLHDPDAFPCSTSHSPKRRRITLSMRLGVLAWVDDLAAESGFSRSFLINLIIWQYARSHGDEPMTDDVVQMMLQEARRADQYAERAEGDAL